MLPYSITMATSVPKVRGVLWTLYNYEPLLDIVRDYGRIECEYMVFGYETCPTTGRPHLQGYLYWKNPRTYPNKLLRSLIKGIHDQVANGSAEDNRKYCLKIRTGDVPNEKFEEFGTMPSQGQRVDWAKAYSQLSSGSSVVDILETQPHLAPCVRQLKEVRLLQLKPRYGPVTVICLIGPPGTGKSRWAYDNYPDLYSKPNGDWWDGYSGEKTILLDDFYGDVKYPLLLKVCDRYPLQVPIKGSFIHAQWDTVIITSNQTPEQWYPSQYDISAFHRRVNKMCINNIPDANQEEYAQEGVPVQETQVRTPSPDASQG